MGKGSAKARLRRKKKLGRAKNAAAAPTTPASSTAATAAAEYLEQWEVRSAQPGTWKFSKTRQTFLLKGWPHRQRVSTRTFKRLLDYLHTLPYSCRERTIEQAREVTKAVEAAEAALEARIAARAELAAAAADGGGDDDDDDDDDGDGGGDNGDGGGDDSDGGGDDGDGGGDDGDGSTTNNDGVQDATKGGVSDDAELEEQRAVLSIQRARALRVLHCLLDNSTADSAP